MKDKQTSLWIYKNSKMQLFSLIALILANALFAGCGVLFALACREVIDAAVQGEKDTLMLQGLWLFAVIVLQFFLRILSRNLEVRIQGRLETGYKQKLLGQLFIKDYAHTSRYHTGELMNRLSSDVAVVAGGNASILPELAYLLTKLLGALAVLYIFDPAFTLVFAAGGLLLFFTAKYFRGKLKHLHKNMQEKDGAARSFMQELLENLVVIKIFGAQREMKEKTSGFLHEHYKAKIKKNTVSILANSGFSFIFSIGYLFALVWSAHRLVAGTMSFGTLTAILQLAGQVQSPFAGLSGLLPRAYGVLASAERLMELENLPGEVEINRKEINVPAVYGNLRNIRFEKVFFGYGRDMVLKNVELAVNKGDFVMITGLSGIGKSTLLKLLLGVFAPAAGFIGFMLDNGERIPADRHTRKLFAYVPQGNLMLTGTIRESIAFARAKTTDAEIMDAAEVSCAAEFIRALPEGLDTVIGEKGLGLSEGQVQRLAIARAVLCGAPILLLDEATSALDEATEEELLENIKRMTDKTCIIITHKKAALPICNKEIRIQGGTLKTIERGNHIATHTA